MGVNLSHYLIVTNQYQSTKQSAKCTRAWCFSWSWHLSPLCPMDPGHPASHLPLAQTFHSVLLTELTLALESVTLISQLHQGRGSGQQAGTQRSSLTSPTNATFATRDANKILTMPKSTVHLINCSWILFKNGKVASFFAEISRSFPSKILEQFLRAQCFLYFEFEYLKNNVFAKNA